VEYLISTVDAAWPHVEAALEKNDSIHVRAYGVLPVTEEFIRKVTTQILRRSGRDDLITTASMLLKELTVNAAKANFKRVIFREHNIDSDNAEQYEQGMTIFKDNLSDDMPYVYGPKAKRNDLHVLIAISSDKNKLHIEVQNNTPMKKHEEQRVREKLALAMSCEDLGDFMMNHGDDSEGAGLGIFLSLAALKAAGVDPRVFVIKTDGKKRTWASFELPIDRSYKPELPRY